MKYSPKKKIANAYTLAETIAEITKARSLGDTVCGTIGDIRYNSDDDLAMQDMNQMAQRIMDELKSIETRFRILERKARKFHEGAPINVSNMSRREEIEELRGAMWDELFNIINYSNVPNDLTSSKSKDLELVD